MEKQQDLMAMYDQYMDMDAINEIISNDEESEIEKDQPKHNNKKSSQKTFDAYSIPINEFLSRYLGIEPHMGVKTFKTTHYAKDKATGKRGRVTETKEVYSYDTLWHSGLKDMNIPYAITVSNEYADENPEKVANGELLIVTDGRGNMGTYINPTYLMELVDKERIQEELEKIEKLRCSGVHELSALADYMEYFVQGVSLQSRMTELQAKLDRTSETTDLLYKTHKLRRFKELKKEINND
jgi:hypothetical protein